MMQAGIPLQVPRLSNGLSGIYQGALLDALKHALYEVQGCTFILGQRWRRPEDLAHGKEEKREIYFALEYK